MKTNTAIKTRAPFWVNFIILFAAIIFCLGFGEIAARIFIKASPRQKISRNSWVKIPEEVWIEYHPTLGWFSKKNKTAGFKTDFASAQVHTNSAGFRGAREYDKSKPQGVTRVIALGDSFTFGFGVNDAETFSAVFEAKSPQWEVLNLGIPAYGLDQIYLSFHEIAAPYHADYVLINLFPEDLWRDLRAFTDSGHAKPYFKINRRGKIVLQNVPVPPPFQLKDDQFPLIIESRWLDRVFSQSRLYCLGKKAFLRLGINLGWVDPDMSEEWQLGRKILKKMIHEIRASGSKPVLVMCPPKDWAVSDRKSSLEKSIYRFARRERVDFLNLAIPFRRSLKTSPLTAYYIEGDWHWTAKGHQLAAQEIQEYLRKQS